MIARPHAIDDAGTRRAHGDAMHALVLVTALLGSPDTTFAIDEPSSHAAQAAAQAIGAAAGALVGEAAAAGGIWFVAQTKVADFEFGAVLILPFLAVPIVTVVAGAAIGATFARTSLISAALASLAGAMVGGLAFGIATRAGMLVANVREPLASYFVEGAALAGVVVGASVSAACIVDE